MVDSEIANYRMTSICMKHISLPSFFCILKTSFQCSYQIFGTFFFYGSRFSICLSLGFRYPVALEQTYAATKRVAQNGQTIHVNFSRLAVAGDSVGGNMAAAVTLLAKERGGPKITFQVLFYPVTNASFDTPSYMKYQEGYWLTGEAMKWFWDNYAPDKAIRKEPTITSNCTKRVAASVCIIPNDHQ